MGIFLVSLTSGAISNLGTFQQDECVELLQTCSTCTYNNISTVIYPNSTVALSESIMTRDGNNYNYSYCFTAPVGEYLVNGHGDLDGTDTIWNYGFSITPSGKDTTTGNAILVFLAVLLFFILGTLGFIGFFKSAKMQIKWTLGLAGFIFFLAGLNLISALIPDALVNENVVTFFDGFTAISFIGFWFAFGLIIIMWILTFFATVLYKRNKRQMEKYG